MDTRGNFYLGIRLPIKDNADKPKLTKKERLRVSAENWKKNNPDKYKEHQEYVKEWKRNNKDRVRQTHKDWYQRENYDKNTIKTIALSKLNYDKLKQLGFTGESFNTVIGRLLEKVEEDI